MIRRAGWVLIVIACVACGGDKKEKVPPPEPGSGAPAGRAAGSAGSGSAAAAPINAAKVEKGRMFSEAEITALLDDLMKRLAANGTRPCPGPKVEPTTLPGPSADALVELFEGTGDIAPCIAKLAELGKNDLRAAIEAKAPEVAAFEKECGEKIAAKVTAAASHIEGCSPYRVGVRAEPKDLMRTLQVAHLVSLHARELAAKGQKHAAVQLSIDALRAYQDLTRGHVTMITAMIAAAAIENLGGNLDTILETAKLDDKQRTEAAASLDALIAWMPRWSDIQAGERDNMDIYFGAAALMPAGWSPPGGWNEEMKPNGKDNYPAKRFGNPRDEAAVLMLMTVDNAADWAKACPDQGTYTECRAGLARLASEAKPAVDADLGSLYAELAKNVATGTADADAVRLRIRRSVMLILKSVAQPAFDKYPIKMAASLGRLAALRLHLEVLKDGKCPAASALGEPPYLTLASPPALGDQLQLKVAGTTVEVAPPASWGVEGKPWSFRCAN